MKKVLSILMAMLMVMLVPVTSLGAGTKPRTEKSGNIEYLKNKDGTASFAGCSDGFQSIKEFSVPETIAGRKVTAIYDYAFSYWRSLTKVTLPGTILSIGEGAFNNCMNLKSLEIPEGVVELGPKFLVASGVQTVIVPSTVTKIDKNAFGGFTYLKDIVVVKGSYAEEFCKKNGLSFSYADSEETNTETATLAGQESQDLTDGAKIEKSYVESVLARRMNNAEPYSTNDQETASIGNTGVYAYVLKKGNYDIYLLIDFDEGYVYRFVEGNGDEICERIAILSGNLMDGLYIIYHDGGDEWGNTLFWANVWETVPTSVLVVWDNFDEQHCFETTTLEEALNIMIGKTIHNY